MPRRNANAVKSRTRPRTRLPRTMLVIDGPLSGTIVRTIGNTADHYIAVQLPDGSLAELHMGQLHS